MKKLSRSYSYAFPLILIGLVVTTIWFPHLLLWFSITALVSMLNYLLLILMADEKKFTQTRILVVLLVRYLIFGVTVFLIIFLNRNSDHFIGIGIITAIGISLMKVASILNLLIHADVRRKYDA